MLHPRDVVVPVAIHARLDGWTFREIAAALLRTPSQVHASLRRAQRSGLYWARERRIIPGALLEFAMHGVRYAFPATVGTLGRDVATADSGPPMSGSIIGLVPWVWPSPHGSAYGQSVEPLHECVHAVISSEAAYELLCLIEVFRVGGPRERHVAAGLLADGLWQGKRLSRAS
jgi:hypothetical protein